MATVSNKMKSSAFEQFRQKLEQKCMELRSQLAIPVANSAVRVYTDPFDTAEWAAKSQEEGIFLQQNNFNSTLLREIEDALDRLRDGSYGTCVECAVPVSRRCLEAIPWARYCVSCQERREAWSEEFEASNEPPLTVGSVSHKRAGARILTPLWRSPSGKYPH